MYGFLHRGWVMADPSAFGEVGEDAQAEAHKPAAAGLVGADYPVKPLFDGCAGLVKAALPHSQLGQDS
jgi:hypothetical protein